MSSTLFPLINDNYSIDNKDKLSMNVIKNIICRLCLQKHRKFVNIFGEEDEHDTNEISRYIEIFFAVEIRKSDPYSTSVCKSCWDMIITLCKYRLQFRKNDALLRSNRENIISEITDETDTTSETTHCHYSVKNILSQGVNLNFNYWNINFDVKVNLSDCRVPDEVVNNNNYLETTVYNIRTDNYCVLRSNKQITKKDYVNKRRHPDDYYKYRCYPNNTFGSIALNRTKRDLKRTKIFGDPFSLADEDADDSDSDPVFSILKSYSCESPINPEMLRTTNIPSHLTTRTSQHFYNHNSSFDSCPKRASAQKARENLDRWLNPKKSTISPFDMNVFPTSIQFQEQTWDGMQFTTIKCPETVWNRFANAQFEKIILINHCTKQFS